MAALAAKGCKIVVSEMKCRNRCSKDFQVVPSSVSNWLGCGSLNIALARTTARGSTRLELEARGWELELEASDGAQTLHFMPEVRWRV